MKTRGIKGGVKMEKKVLFRVLVMPLVIFAAACGEISVNELYRPAGSEIMLSAACGYANGMETRTEYSGDARSVTGYTYPFERIDWCDGDMITVSYVRGGNRSYADFRVGVPEADAERSDAPVTSNDKLYWADGIGNHVIHAMYPARNFSGNTSAGLTNGNHVTGSIPGLQTLTLKDGRYQPAMEYAYMVAREEIEESGTDRSVTLHFVPAMTAFEFRFRLAQGEAPVTVTGFEMRSASSELCGSFAFDITGGSGADRSLTYGNYTTTGAGSAVSVNFGSGVELGAENCLDFTVLVLPAQIDDVTVAFTFADGTTKSLDLKHEGAFVTFDACKKYVITNDNVPGAETWTYVVEEIDDIVAYGHSPVNGLGFNVKSYKYSSRAPEVKVAVHWTVQYSSNGSNWSDSNGSTDFSVVNTNGLGVDDSSYYAGESNAANIANSTSGSTTGEASDATRAVLASATPRGTDEAPFDLSIHPCYGDKDVATSQNTANCYIVSAPGVYMFPLVYGNAIKNGVDNVISYAPESVTHLYQQYSSEAHVVYQANFHNAVNANITGPYIFPDLSSYGTVSDLNAAIVWQDVPAGERIIPFDEVEVIGSGSSAYIKFKVSADDIRQGNVVIALRGKVGNILPENSILWSWHIWVTEKDLNPVTVVHPVNGTTEMAAYNLGWTDKTTAMSTKYPDREYYFKIVQTEEGGTSESFKIRQIGDATSTPDNIGANTFYQWGRKDPFLPAASSNANKSVSAGPGYTIVRDSMTLNLESISSSGDPDFGYGIRNPHIMLKNNYTSGWVGGATHVGGTDVQRQNSSIAYNLWSAYVRTQADKTTLGGKAKTVYDPCPPGFPVPSLYAFSGFAGFTGSSTPNNQYYPRKGTVASDGFNFYRNGSSGATICIPFCGARGYQDTGIYDVTSCGYYWTDCPDISTYPGTGDHNGWRMSKNMLFTDSSINPVYDLYKGAAYAIRPVLE